MGNLSSFASVFVKTFLPPGLDFVDAEGGSLIFDDMNPVVVPQIADIYHVPTPAPMTVGKETKVPVGKIKGRNQRPIPFSWYGRNTAHHFCFSIYLLYYPIPHVSRHLFSSLEENGGYD